MPKQPEDYRAILRTHVAEHGVPVKATSSRYNGWDDFDAAAHARSEYGGTCSWVVPEGSMLTESTDVEWGGTFGDDHTFYVVDVSGAHCACGKFTDRTLRLTTTFGDLMRTVLGENGGIPL